MNESVTPLSFTPFDARFALRSVGLRRVYDLNVRGYWATDDVQVVAMFDPERRTTRPSATADWPTPRALLP